MNRRQFVLAGLAAGSPLGGCSTPGVKLDVPYVSTPAPVVEGILRLAAVRADDIVYDLGCGDGRVVIAAARDFGARGVGIDIDPRRIEEANAAARSAGVQKQVRFAVRDLFETDFSEASVLVLYLFPELNARLKPKILGELRPGARVVSHQFLIGDWPPLKRERFIVATMDHTAYLWVVPPR
ncbi:MAG TPA: class I SAM-dependent methyltransferase [Burkholderiales bacterium]|nr:class I SAM-dependent methyltransferase [Burkholderiales bacterium]